MKYMLMHYSTDENEAGVVPGPEEIARIEAYMGEVASTGVFLGGEGVGPSSLGARLDFDGGKVTVTDGPYAEAKEVVAGFAILDVSSKEEAIEHAKRWAQVVGTPRIDVRRVAEF